MKKTLLIAFIILLGCLNQAFADTQNVSTEAKFYYNQGVDYYKGGLYDKSMDAFRQAINTDPNYIDAYYNLGTILEYQKQDSAALAMFKQIILRKPDDYDSVYKAAEISNRLGLVDEAKSYLALIPANALAYKKATGLAYAMGTDMQTLKAAQQAKAQKELQASSSIPQTNGVYSNLASPTGITTDKSNNLYVASFSDNTIYKITPEGKKIIKLKDARLSGPIGIAMDSAGNLYIANYNKNNILKVSSSGQISVILANISKPYIVHIYGNLLFVSAQGSNSVVRYRIH